MPGRIGGTQDRRYMRMALRLARKAAGRTSPNPMVGAVLVKNSRVIATGYHRAAGGDHAEIVALKRAGDKAKGATLYINLEPCSHQGRTPPCTNALIRAGVHTVIAGMRDPNPLVAGSGFRKLKRAGIQVRVGVLEEECRILNEAFTKYIIRRLPFVILKLAASLDGKIAAASGDARWISDEHSRRVVHRLRNQVDAVLVGAGTVVADDPQLTCRIPGGRNPWRVVLDAALRTPMSAKILHQPDPEKTILVTSLRAPERKLRALTALGIQVWTFAPHGRRIPWLPFLKRLAQIGVVSVMIEGGAITAAWALEDKIVDKLLFFYAPKILGGKARVMVDGLEVARVKDALAVHRMQMKKTGTGFLVSGYL